MKVILIILIVVGFIGLNMKPYDKFPGDRERKIK